VVPLLLAIHAAPAVATDVEPRVDVESPGDFAEDDPILHVLVAEMHEFPQGIPFLQFFCAASGVVQTRSAVRVMLMSRDILFVLRSVSPPQ
jgi:hypothetical protein